MLAARNAGADQPITYGIYGPGEYLGEMSLDGGPRSADVEVIETGYVVLVTRRTLEAHLAELPLSQPRCPFRSKE